MKKTINLLILTFFIKLSVFSQITDTGDKVGIGTENPSEKLHINGSLYMNVGEGFKIFGDINYFGQYKDGIIFQMQDVNGLNGNTDGGFVFRGFTPTDGVFKDWMVIKNGGNVGIGTINPDAKLTVAGNIHTREVKVTVNAGADFIFEKEYELPSLESVEEYVNENKHLPEIASAKEMVEGGIYLSEMNIKLLQKIEELTLYVIAQNKKIVGLQNQITDIKN